MRLQNLGLTCYRPLQGLCGDPTQSKSSLAVRDHRESSDVFLGYVEQGLKGLISVLVGVALVPIAILLVQLWQTTAAIDPMQIPNAMG
jgi:hypothetical protein